MRIRSTEKRERRIERLKDATGEKTKSGAIDVAADYYIQMAGETTAQPTGFIEELMRRADQEGALTIEEIADVLDVDELPVSASTEWSVGET
jgi:hypothetical protein